MTKINVLDHGFVRLIDCMGSDLSVVRAARVSYDAAWRVKDEQNDTRLINYLWRNNHTSPFEAVQFTFEVKAPIFVLRQWHRHRTWSYNELSARYRELPEEFYVPEWQVLGTQSTNNKQGRAEPMSEEWAKKQADRIDIACKESFREYKALLAAGVSRELARSVLPVATYSHMFASVNLLNLFRFLTLRCDKHAQFEIRAYADTLYGLIKPVVPVCAEAWNEEFMRNQYGPA